MKDTWIGIDLVCPTCRGTGWFRRGIPCLSCSGAGRTREDRAYYEVAYKSRL